MSDYVELSALLTKLDATGVGDLPEPTRVDFINLALNEIYDKYPWPFREYVALVSNPAETPILQSGNEVGIKVRWVSTLDGTQLKPVTQDYMRSLGVTFGVIGLEPPERGEPEVYCTFVSGSPVDQLRHTIVLPYPYTDELYVGVSVPAQELSDVPGPSNPFPGVEPLFPKSYAYAIVYRAAVHAYNMLGVPDLAESYQTRYVELLDSLMDNQFFMEPVPDMEIGGW